MELFPAVLYIPLTIMCAVLVCHIDIAKGLDLTEVNVVCNTDSYLSPSEHEDHLKRLIGRIIKLTPKLSFRVCVRDPIWDGGEVSFGSGACNGHLSEGDCNHCLTSLVNNLKSQCPNRIGAQAELPDCRMRYEIYKFAF